MDAIITPANILQHELIGLHVRVAKTTYKNMQDKDARVIDESQKMLTLRFDNGDEKSIPKESGEFIFTIPDGRKVAVKGTLLLGNPEERIKKKVPKRWDVID